MGDQVSTIDWPGLSGAGDDSFVQLRAEPKANTASRIENDYGSDEAKQSANEVDMAKKEVTFK